MLKTIVVLVLFGLSISCNKQKMEEYTGVIKDYTGLDGCGLMIDLDNGSRLEPMKNESGTPLEKNRRVAVKFRRNPSMSICMAGETVEIVSLRYL